MLLLKALVCFLSVLTVGSHSSTRLTWEKNYWYENDKEALKIALREPNKNVAKNLVLAIGDGMDVDTTTAIRIYRGQLTHGLLGEEALLTWDKFPYTGLSKTYSTDMMTTDSAASSTAFNCGVKTKYEMLGVDDTVVRKDCSTVEAAKVSSVLKQALEAGKSVGIITTDSVVGASPAGTYAHAAFRGWTTEVDPSSRNRELCKDIARQLVEDNLDIQVILGGGRQYFLPNYMSDPRNASSKGFRTDGKNLVEQWQTAQRAKGRKARYVTDQAEFDAATPENTDYLFGMFEPDRVQEETERRKTNQEPSIAEMTKKAIEILRKNEKGFYLFIEGANIDLGHHENRARMALEEGLAFEDAVSTVVNMTSTNDTLVIVSADHSHAFSFGGYSKRGSSILSVASNDYYPQNLKDRTGNRYTILAYGNGPGFQTDNQRVNLTLPENKGYYDVDRVYQSAFPLPYDTHGGADVPLYASGPMAHIFTGVHEQTFIANGMAYAACIGRDKSHCNPAPATTAADTSCQGSDAPNLFPAKVLVASLAVMCWLLQ
ncbi:alkaline phosphatase-like [Watersipora subatra]|uniref:alkaline phosphatase-like n=1 Tax=Watersipora subatra TaxID=2589382 RepID=UPI00355C0919